MANSLTDRLDALEANFMALDAALAEDHELSAELSERLAAAETKAKQQHGTIVALQTALKDKGK